MTLCLFSGIFLVLSIEIDEIVCYTGNIKGIFIQERKDYYEK